MEKALHAEECNFARAVELSAPVLASPPGAALGVPFATRLQV